MYSVSGKDSPTPVVCGFGTPAGQKLPCIHPVQEIGVRGCADQLETHFNFSSHHSCWDMSEI